MEENGVFCIVNQGLFYVLIAVKYLHSVMVIKIQGFLFFNLFNLYNFLFLFFYIFSTSVTNINNDFCLSTNYQLIVNPCQNCLTQLASYSIISLAYESDVYYPIINKPLNISISKSSIIIDIELNKPGIVYCSAVLSSVESILITSNYIRSHGSSNILTNQTGGNIDVTIEGLSPSTEYNIYCYTEDFYSHFMTNIATRETKVIISTLCCKSIEFQSKSLYNFNENDDVIIEFVIDSLPINEINVLINIEQIIDCHDNSNFTLNSVTASPQNINFTINSLSLNGNFKISGNAGCYKITAYTMPFDNYNNDTISIVIYPEYLPPIQPIISSAILSNDGHQIHIYLNTNSDKGVTVISNSNIKFNCDIILDFIDTTSSSCLWINDKEIIVSINNDPDSLETINIGDTITLLGNIIKPICINITCVYSNSSITTLLEPLSPVYPKISLVSLPSINYCEGIQINTILTTGDATRAWKQINWDITWSPSIAANSTIDRKFIKNENSIIIENYLNKYYNKSIEFIDIPSFYLTTESGTYQISLTLMNFLNKASISSKEIDINTIKSSSSTITPRVTISSPTNVFQYNRQSIYLYANTTVPLCNNYNGNNSNNELLLTYKWSIYLGSTLLPITSSSKDVRVFKVPAYSLQALNTYVISVTVSGISTIANQLVLPTSSHVSFQIGQEGVVANINGGLIRTISSFDINPIVIDASTSYDLDYNSNNDLIYIWSCNELLPDYGNPCLVNELIAANNNKYTSILNLPSISFQSNIITSMKYKITVYVYTKNLLIFDYTSIEMEILQEIIPEVRITNNLKKKYNVDNKIILSGNINTILNNSIAKWSSTSSIELLSNIDNNNDLKSIILTPISKIIDTIGSISFQLAIKPYSLTPGLSYSFRLNSNYISSNTVSFAQVSILINEPPRNGVFYIHPRIGTALVTYFALKTQYWVDDFDDFPIVYAFSYYSLYPSSIIIKTRSEINHISSKFGQGLESFDYNITCAVTAIDIYGSSANLSSTIIVYPPSNSSSSNSIANLIDSTSNDINNAIRSHNPEIVNQLIYAMTSIINTPINCSLVSINYCTSINRNLCSKTINTCGSCLNGFLGPIGDSNYPCQLPQDLLKIGSICTANVSCLTGYCSTNGYCIDTKKICRNQCSNNGNCIAYDSNNIELNNGCYNSDALCKVKCECNDGYYGSDCSLTLFEMNEIRSLRMNLCHYAYKNIFIEDVNKDIIVARTSMISLVLYDIDEINNYALNNCTYLLVDTINSNSNLIDDNTAINCMDSLSIILDKGSLLPQVLLDDVISAISTIKSIFQENMAIGEPMINIITSNTRMSTGIFDHSEFSLNSPLIINPPQNEVEIFNEIATSSLQLSLSNQSISSVIGLLLVQFNNNPRGIYSDSTGISIEVTQYQTNSIENFNSRRLYSDNNVIFTTFSSINESTNNEPNNNLELTIILQNLNPIEYFEELLVVGNVSCIYNDDELKWENGYEDTIYCENSYTNLITEYNYICPPFQLGNFYDYKCPQKSVLPRCLIWDGDSYTHNSDCTVVDYSSTNTTCLCTTNNNNLDKSRNLIENNSNDFAISSEYKSLKEVTSSDYTCIYKWQLDDIIIKKDIVNDYIIISTMGSILTICIIGIIITCLTDINIKENKFKKINQSDKDLTKIEAKEEENNFNIKKKLKQSEELLSPDLESFNFSKEPYILSIEEFFNSILPMEFNNNSWYNILYEKLIEEHDWIYIIGRIFNYKFISKSSNSILLNKLNNNNNDKMIDYNEIWFSIRWFYAIIRILNILMFDTLLFTTLYADDGLCESYNIKSNCLRFYTYDNINTLCQWNSDIHSCSYQQPNHFNLISTLILTIMITTFIVPIDILVKRSINCCRELYQNEYRYVYNQNNSNKKHSSYYMTEENNKNIENKIKNFKIPIVNNFEDKKKNELNIIFNVITFSNLRRKFHSSCIINNNKIIITKKPNNNTEMSQKSRNVNYTVKENGRYDFELNIFDGDVDEEKNGSEIERYFNGEGKYKYYENSISNSSDCSNNPNNELSYDELSYINELTTCSSYQCNMLKGVRLDILKNSLDNNVSIELEANKLIEYYKNQHYWPEINNEGFSNLELNKNDNFFDKIKKVSKILQYIFNKNKKIIGNPVLSSNILKFHLSQIEDKITFNYGLIGFNSNLLYNNINFTREKTRELINEIQFINSTFAKEQFILKSFIIYYLKDNYKMNIAKRFLFSQSSAMNSINEFSIKSETDKDEDNNINMKHYLSLLFLLIYFLSIIVLFSLLSNETIKLGEKSSKIWLLGLIICVIEDIILLQPMKILMKYYFISSIIINDIRIINKILKIKSKNIINRKFGMVNNAISLIQSFHPVNRLCREFPELPISRLILSLNDFDIPLEYYNCSLSDHQIRQTNNLNSFSSSIINILKNIKNLKNTIMEIIFELFFLLPHYFQDCISEVFFILIFNFKIIILALTWNINKVLPFIIILFSIIMYILIKYNTIEERMMIMKRLQPLFGTSKEECVDYISNYIKNYKSNKGIIVPNDVPLTTIKEYEKSNSVNIIIKKKPLPAIINKANNRIEVVHLKNESNRKSNNTKESNRKKLPPIIQLPPIKQKNIRQINQNNQNINYNNSINNGNNNNNITRDDEEDQIQPPQYLILKKGIKIKKQTKNEIKNTTDLESMFVF
jgi:hypothetical protein